MKARYTLNGTTIDLMLGYYAPDCEYICAVETPRHERGRGQARALMGTVCTIADEENLELCLIVGPDDEGYHDRLEAFYRSFGFEYRPEGHKNPACLMWRTRISERSPL